MALGDLSNFFIHSLGIITYASFLVTLNRYAGTKQFAVKNITLDLKVGERLAVVGMNGSGKTTFIKLLG